MAILRTVPRGSFPNSPTPDILARAATQQASTPVVVVQGQAADDAPGQSVQVSLDAVVKATGLPKDQLLTPDGSLDLEAISHKMGGSPDDYQTIDQLASNLKVDKSELIAPEAPKTEESPENAAPTMPTEGQTDAGDTSASPENKAEIDKNSPATVKDETPKTNPNQAAIDDLEKQVDVVQAAMNKFNEEHGGAYAQGTDESAQFSHLADSRSALLHTLAALKDPDTDKEQAAEIVKDAGDLIKNTNPDTAKYLKGIPGTSAANYDMAAIGEDYAAGQLNDTGLEKLGFDAAGIQAIKDTQSQFGELSQNVGYKVDWKNYDQAIKDNNQKLDEYMGKLSQAVGYKVTSANTDQAMNDLKTRADAEQASYTAHLADLTGMKPSQLYTPDGKLNQAALADKFGGKPSEYTSINVALAKIGENSFAEDAFREVVTFGKASTRTFNQDDVIVSYQRAANDARAKGMELTESQSEFVARTMKDQGSTGKLAGDFIINMTPIVGTVKNWDNMGTGGKALSVGLDFLTVVPFVGTLAAASREGLSLGRAVTRATVAEIKAPFTTIAHPVATAKAAYGALESIVMPRNIPLQSLEVSYHTIRLPVKAVGGDGKLAMKLRDEIMTNSATGRGAAAEIEGTRATIGTKAANEVVQTVVFHGSPDIRPFMDGISINSPKEPKATTGGMYVAPSLNSRFAIAKSGGQAVEGGVKGFLMITDPKLTSALRPSGKLYKGTAEMELVLPNGIELPKPSQVVYSRAANGERLTGLIIGPKLSPRQIASMKLMGAPSLIQDIFNPRTHADVEAFNKYDAKAAQVADIKKNIKVEKQPQLKKAMKENLRAAETELEALRQDVRRAYATTERVGVGAISYKNMFNRARSPLELGSRPAIRGKVRSAIDLDPRAALADDGRGTIKGGRRALTDTRGKLPSRLDLERAARDATRVAITTPERGRIDERTRTPAPPRAGDPTRTSPPDNPRPPVADRQNPPGVGRLSKTDKQDKGERVKAQPGDVIWRQGVVWVTKRKGIEKPIYTSYPPEGHENTKGSPNETAVKRGKPQDHDAVTMGFAHIDIDTTKKQILDFERRPTKLRQHIPRNVKRQIGM